MAEPLKKKEHLLISCVVWLAAFQAAFFSYFHIASSSFISPCLSLPAVSLYHRQQPVPPNSMLSYLMWLSFLWEGFQAFARTLFLETALPTFPLPPFLTVALPILFVHLHLCYFVDVLGGIPVGDRRWWAWKRRGIFSRHHVAWHQQYLFAHAHGGRVNDGGLTGSVIYDHKTATYPFSALLYHFQCVVSGTCLACLRGNVIHTVCAHANHYHHCRYKSPVDDMTKHLQLVFIVA